MPHSFAETTMRHAVASLVILSALACHPAAHSAREALAPDSAVEPIVACVRSALADAPNVKETRLRKDHPRSVYAIFLNPPDPQAGGMELVVAPTRGTPRQLVAAYTLWTGNLTKPGVPNLARLNAPSVEAMAAELLRAAHNQCAPAAAGEPACSMSNFNERITGRCSVGI